MASAKNGKVIHLKLPSRLELLGVVDKLADGITEHMEFDDVDRDAVAISVIEACTNAIQHGNASDADRMVNVTFRIEADTLTISIEDDGRGFRPASEEDATPPDLLATRGRGIFIMREMMDGVTFDFSRGTKVSLVKHRSKPGSGEGEGGAAS
jgi:anti-sigma regulatory factor (Ser/Thr protein kinase)